MERMSAMMVAWVPVGLLGVVAATAAGLVWFVLRAVLGGG